MSEAERVVRELYASAFDPHVLATLVSRDLVYHLPDGTVGGYRELEGGCRALRDAFPDAEFAIEELEVDGDRVTVRWRMEATHGGRFAGIRPTGRRVSMTGMHTERVVAGKVVERSGDADHDHLVAQLTGEMRFWAPRLLISAAPLAATPVLFALLAAGVLSFGGGEKDLVLLVPWAGWSLLFLAITLVGWRKELSVPRCVLVGMAGATVLSVVGWALLGLVAPGAVGIRW